MSEKIDLDTQLAPYLKNKLLDLIDLEIEKNKDKNPFFLDLSSDILKIINRLFRLNVIQNRSIYDDFFNSLISKYTLKNLEITLNTKNNKISIANLFLVFYK